MLKAMGSTHLRLVHHGEPSHSLRLFNAQVRVHVHAARKCRSRYRFKMQLPGRGLPVLGLPSALVGGALGRDLQEGPSDRAVIVEHQDFAVEFLGLSQRL